MRIVNALIIYHYMPYFIKFFHQKERLLELHDRVNGGFKEKTLHPT
jgi:hypothetical protein